MDRSILVRLLGFPATLLHGDTLVLDRWRWLRRRLPRTANGETLLDVGSGTGAFTIGAARRGYRSVGMSWDERNQAVSRERAQLCGAPNAHFVVGDARALDRMTSLDETYDVIICMECVEHILDDRALFNAMSRRLKPGGRLLLSTPNYLYHPISKGDLGPFLTEETGWHVRRGYTPAMLEELCAQAGLEHPQITYCSGFVSQKATALWRHATGIFGGGAVCWVLTLPLRLLPVTLPDGTMTSVLRWPPFSICLEAYKPRFSRNLTKPAGQQAQ